MFTLSIITINYNNFEGLTQTLCSVEIQSCFEFEHIIIDGGSSDNSITAIESYVDFFDTIQSPKRTGRPIVSWVSEKDCGIYDAMNKGVRKASGDYLFFLNSGDTLASPFAIEKMKEQLDGTDCIFGRVYFTRQGQVEGQSALLSESDMSMYHMFLKGVNHQSVLIRRDLLLKIPYDSDVRMGGDWKFFVQAIVLGGASTRFVDVFFANYDLSGISSDTRAIIQEREALLETVIPKRIAQDYLAIAPHYYEVIRVDWLLHHPFWYSVYRAWATLGRSLSRFSKKESSSNNKG